MSDKIGFRNHYERYSSQILHFMYKSIHESGTNRLNEFVLFYLFGLYDKSNECE